MVSDPAAANAVRWHLFPSLLVWLLGCLRRGRGHDCIWPKGTPSSVHARAPCADAGAGAAASPRECPPRLRHKTVKHRRSASASMTCGVPAPAQMLFAQHPLLFALSLASLLNCRHNAIILLSLLRHAFKIVSRPPSGRARRPMTRNSRYASWTRLTMYESLCSTSSSPTRAHSAERRRHAETGAGARVAKELSVAYLQTSIVIGLTAGQRAAFDAASS